MFFPKTIKFTNKCFKKWKKIYPMATIMGHKDVTMTKKTCPNFDVLSWVKKKQNNMKDTNSQVIVPLCDLKNKPNPNATLETHNFIW